MDQDATLGSGRVEFPKPHLCLCRHQRWFHQLPWKEALRERFACLQLQAAKDKQDFKNHLTQRSDREGKLSASALDGETDRTTSWSEFPCRPLGAALSASLLSCLIQILTAWQGSKVAFFFLLQDAALHKCQQMNPDKVINQFNRMKALCTKGWCEIIA